MAPIQSSRPAPFFRAQTAPAVYAPHVRAQKDALIRANTAAQSARLPKAAGWHIPRLPALGFTVTARFKHLMGEARSAFVAQNFVRAQRKVEQAIQIDPTHFDARMLRALVQVSMGNNDVARAQFADLLKERPYDEGVHMARALLAFNLRDDARAWMDLTQVTTRYPGNTVAWLFHALANAQLGHHAMAQRDIDHMRATLPEAVQKEMCKALKDLCFGHTIDAWYGLAPIVGQPKRLNPVSIFWGHIYASLGYQQSAVDTYDKILRDNPMDIPAAVLRAGILQRLSPID